MPSVFHLIIASLTSFTARAGLPTITFLRSQTESAGRKAKAPTIHSSPDCYNCPLKKNPDTCKEECLTDLENFLKENADTTAAVILEPILQGASGMKIFKKEVLIKIESLCEKYDIILILDEIFTGFGRTGKDFAYQYADIKPDIIALAKGLTGGVLPLAATLVSEKVYEAFNSDIPHKAFYHGHTMTGNPSACAAGLASLELYEQENRLEDVKRLESKLKKQEG